ncbi:hypothetical protein GCM10009422_18270 [Brevundimonas kwangchunensis]|uniref:Uncharacterized protein n=1 Tax=Brevundimonas kwangchunensis TaxID=322163 RepID=A0ABP3S0I2_9CAUL
MLRALRIFVVLSLFWLPASLSQACELAVPRNPGETEAHAYERLFRADQDRYWAEADTVFVGKIVGKYWRGRHIQVEVLPRASFKGDAGSGVVTYELSERQGIEMQCGQAAYPEFDRAGLFYASGEDGRLTVLRMLGPNHIRNDSLRAQTIHQLSPLELTDWKTENPTPSRGPLIFAYLFAFCTFIAGLALGRFWRHGNKRAALQANDTGDL